MSTINYDFTFGPDTPYGHAYKLITENAERGGLVVDFGCGSAPLSGPLQELGFSYLGIDIDAAAVENLLERGHEAIAVDLTDQDALIEAVEEAVGSRRLSAFLAMDSIEHLSDPEAFLETLRHLAVEFDRPTLIVSIPNVAHIDVGAKLLHGRWDTTETGLLDKTHLSFFTSNSLTSMLAQYGWYEAARADFRMDRSDQHFPATHPGIAFGSATGAFLRTLREAADGNGTVNQFVRAYTCGNTVPQPQPATPQVGLSIIVRTQGKRLELLEESLLSLAGQSADDFEVLLMVHSLREDSRENVRAVVGPFSPSFSRRVRIIEVQGGDRARPLNKGLQAAAGRYVAFLDDDDVVTSDWVETFLTAAEDHPGAVIRTITADQVVRRNDSSIGYDVMSGPTIEPARLHFSLVEHLETNRTPICAFAVPLEALRTYSIEFDEDLPVLEDWHFLIRVATYCGVHNVRRVTSIYRRWNSIEASWHAIDRTIWTDSAKRIQLEIDSKPLLLPKGSASAIARLIQENYRWNGLGDDPQAVVDHLERMRDELDAAIDRITSIEASTSWRVTAPLRSIGDFVKARRRRR